MSKTTITKRAPAPRNVRGMAGNNEDAPLTQNTVRKLEIPAAMGDLSYEVDTLTAAVQGLSDLLGSAGVLAPESPSSLGEESVGCVTKLGTDIREQVERLRGLRHVVNSLATRLEA